jgi:hypothetical protein
VKITLTAADLEIVWRIVAARLVENRRLSMHDLYLETLDEYARVRAEFASGDPYVFAVGSTRWRARTTPEGGLDLLGEPGAAGRR